jgi:hypothetical protein
LGAFSSKIVFGSQDNNTIPVCDVPIVVANTKISSLSHDTNSAVPILDSPIISLDSSGWFTNAVTGCCLGRVPVDVSSYNWQTKGSYCIGWTMDHELLILDFSSVVV